MGSVAKALLVVAANVATGAAMAAEREIVIERPVLLLGDVFDLTPLPAGLRDRAALLELATLPVGVHEVPLRRLAGRARSRMPVLAQWIGEGAGETVRVRRVGSAEERAPRARLAAMSCVKLETGLPVGAIVRSGDVSATDCPTTHLPAAFRYDRAVGGLRVRNALVSGSVVPAPPRDLLVPVAPGDEVHLTAAVGAVRIVRRVESLQPAHASGRVFVRAHDGAVFAITLGGRDGQ